MDDNLLRNGDDNLLRNGGFEGGWCRDTRYWTADGGPYFTAFGNIFTPEHWVSWWQEGTKNYGSPPDQLTGRPEVNITTPIPDPVRVYSGIHAAQIFTFWRNQKCGLYQVVEGVEPGQRLRLTAFAHGWYSDCDFKPHGPPYFPDCTTQAVDSHMYLRVGISPTGMEDPLWTGDVVWSENVEIYGRYGPMLVVEAVAEGDTVTAFLRSNTNFALKHCDTYWDHVSLEVVDEGEPCKGLPRMQYDAQRVLLPQGATEAEWNWAIDRYPGYTFTESADEAGVGDLDVLNVVAVNPDKWAGGAAGLTEFYAEHYPQVQLAFVYYTPPSGPPWTVDISDDLLTNPGPYESEILNEQGGWWQRELSQIDGLTFHHTLSSDPMATAAHYIQKGGGRPSIPYHIWITKAGTVIKCLDLEEGCWHDHTGNRNSNLSVGLEGRLDTNAPTDAMLDAAARVAVWAIKDEEMAVTLGKIKGHRDYTATICPGWQSGWKDDLYNRIYALLGIEPPPSPVVFNPRVLTLHLQQDVEAGRRFVSTCKPSAIKRVHGAQNLPTYAVLNPGMRCIYRGMDESEDPVTFINMHIDTLHQVADMFEERGLPLIDGKYFWFELWNEVYGYDREPNIMWRDREIAATLELARREPRVGVVAFNAGVGNIRVENFDVLVPLARVVADNAGMFGLHSYFGATPDRCSIDHYEDEGRWLESRWEMTDDYLVAHGVKVNWFLSEGGAIYYQPPTNMPYSSDGWKHPNCMGSDWSRYLAYLEKLARHYYQQNLKREGRLKGYAIFTQGGWNTWKLFELGSAEIDAIAAMQARIWPVVV